MKLAVLLAAVAGIASAAAPAMALDQTVRATNSNTWSPSAVIVNAGDSVRFTNSNDGTHNLHFDGETQAVTPLSSSWAYDRTFLVAGTFGFLCDIHPRMTGSVVVLQPTTPSPTGTLAPSGADVVLFRTSPRSLRVSKAGRFEYSFLATPLRSGKITLESTKKVKIGSKKRAMKLAAKAFTASSTGNVRVKFNLSRKNLKALKKAKRLSFVVTAALGAKRLKTKLTLKAPKKA